MSNVDITVDRQTDGRTDGRKIGRLYRTLLQAGAIKMANAYANCADPDQSLSGSTLFTIPFPLSILRNNYIKSKI